MRLYELLRSPGCTLIVFLSPQQVNDERPVLLDLLALAAQSGVSANVVLDAGLPKQHELEADILIDYKGELEQKLAAHPGQVFLLRPDAYIAFQSDSLEVAVLADN